MFHTRSAVHLALVDLLVLTAKSLSVITELVFASSDLLFSDRLLIRPISECGVNMQLALHLEINRSQGCKISDTLSTKRASR